MRSHILWFFLMSFSLLASGFSSGFVALRSATATYSQNSAHGPGNTIDGTAETSWAIATPSISTSPQTIVWATDSNLPSAPVLEVTLAFSDKTVAPGHSLGRFRISATKDQRNSFADGLIAGGDVSATWQVLSPVSFASTEGDSATFLPDGSVVVSGPTNYFPTYTVQFTNTLVGITGFRLEAMLDSSLPTDGPGRQRNGNFHLAEFAVSKVPEPGIALSLIGTLAVRLARRRRPVDPRSHKAPEGCPCGIISQDADPAGSNRRRR